MLQNRCLYWTLRINKFYFERHYNFRKKNNDIVSNIFYGQKKISKNLEHTFFWSKTDL